MLARFITAHPGTSPQIEISKHAFNITKDIARRLEQEEILYYCRFCKAYHIAYDLTPISSNLIIFILRAFENERD